MKKLVGIIAVLLFGFSGTAQAKKGAEGFDLYGRFSLVVEDGGHRKITGAVVGLLDSLGCRRYAAAETCGDRTPCFLIRRSPIEMPDSANVYLRVEPQAVVLDYNNRATAAEIAQALRDRLAARRNRRGVIRALSLQASPEGDPRPYLFVDLSARTYDLQNLRERVRKAVGEGYTTVYLLIFTNSGAGVRNGTFVHAADRPNPFLRPGAVTASELGALVDGTDAADLVVTVNLFGDNEHFREVTGHPLLSDEGMRFVDDYLESVFYGNRIRECQVNTDCSEREEKLFVQPLVSRIRGTGVRVIYNRMNNQ